MSDINVGQFSEALNDKMDRDAHNVQSPSAVVVEKQDPTAENNYTWYRKYSDGWVEQGGYPTTSSTITFPVPMTDNKYFFICHYVGSSTSTTRFNNYGHTPTTTGFSYDNANTAGTTTFVWFVSGKAAN